MGLGIDRGAGLDDGRGIQGTSNGVVDGVLLGTGNSLLNGRLRKGNNAGHHRRGSFSGNLLGVVNKLIDAGHSLN